MNRPRLTAFATMMAVAATVSATAQMPQNMLRVRQTQVRLITTQTDS